MSERTGEIDPAEGPMCTENKELTPVAMGCFVLCFSLIL